MAMKAFRKQVSLKDWMLAFLITALVLALCVMYGRQDLQQRRERKIQQFVEWYQHSRPIANIPTRYGDLFPDSRVKDGVAIIPLDDADAVLELLGTDTWRLEFVESNACITRYVSYRLLPRGTN